MYVLAGLSTWNIPLLTVLACLSIGYLLILKYHQELPLFSVQSVLFHCSLMLFYLMMGSPLTTLSHVTFSTHMIQMSILFLIVPPLFLIGLPRRLLQYTASIPLVRKLSVSPLAALIVFSILFFLYHLPQVLPFLLQDPLIHTGFILFLLYLSLAMWQPITAPESNCKDKKKRFSLLSGVLLMPACLLFIVNGLVDGGSNFSLLAIKLCIAPGQMDALLPFRLNTRFDQIAGGILMMGLHKFALYMTWQLDDKLAQPRDTAADAVETIS